MAAKGSRPGRLETEIEKYRGDGNWPRVLDLSRQLSAKTPHLGICYLTVPELTQQSMLNCVDASDMHPVNPLMLFSVRADG